MRVSYGPACLQLRLPGKSSRLSRWTRSSSDQWQFQILPAYVVLTDRELRLALQTGEHFEHHRPVVLLPLGIFGWRLRNERFISTPGNRRDDHENNQQNPNQPLLPTPNL